MQINPALKGHLTLLAEGATGSPRISGDGTTVVWDQLVGDHLEIMRAVGNKVDQLTHDPRTSMQPDVSEHGDTIAWTRFSSTDPNDPKGTFGIYAWHNGAEAALETANGNSMSAAVSRDGQVVAWDTDNNGRAAHWDIHRATIGGPVEAVTNDTRDHEFPFLSADGTRVYWRDGSTGKQQVWMKDGNAAPAQVLHTNGDQVRPSVTPDGRTIQWTDDTQSDDDILVQQDGHTRPVSAQRGTDETWATMSADAQHFAWTNIDRNGAAPSMQVYLKDGDTTQPLTTGDDGLNTFPQMSDDGKSITWVWVDQNNSHHSRIYRFDRDRSRRG